MGLLSYLFPETAMPSVPKDTCYHIASDHLTMNYDLGHCYGGRVFEVER